MPTMGSAGASKTLVRSPQRKSSKKRYGSDEEEAYSIFQGKKMINLSLDLNKPPVEDNFGQSVVLSKDHKTICRAKCYNAPVEFMEEGGGTAHESVQSIVEVAPSKQIFLEEAGLVPLRRLGIILGVFS